MNYEIKDIDGTSTLSAGDARKLEEITTTLFKEIRQEELGCIHVEYDIIPGQCKPICYFRAFRSEAKTLLSCVAVEIDLFCKMVQYLKEKKINVAASQRLVDAAVKHSLQQNGYWRRDSRIRVIEL